MREGLTMTVLGMWVMGEDCDGLEIVSVFRKVLIINILKYCRWVKSDYL